MAYSYKQVTNDFMKILSVQYICDYFFQDNYCPDSIMMWSAHTIIQTCMHMLRRALSLCQWGKEPIPTNTCQYRITYLLQRHISTVKYRLSSVHRK